MWVSLTDINFQTCLPFEALRYALIYSVVSHIKIFGPKLEVAFLAGMGISISLIYHPRSEWKTFVSLMFINCAQNINLPISSSFARLSYQYNTYEVRNIDDDTSDDDTERCISSVLFSNSPFVGNHESEQIFYNSHTDFCNDHSQLQSFRATYCNLYYATALHWEFGALIKWKIWTDVQIFPSQRPATRIWTFHTIQVDISYLPFLDSTVYLKDPCMASNR